MCNTLYVYFIGVLLHRAWIVSVPTALHMMFSQLVSESVTSILTNEGRESVGASQSETSNGSGDGYESDFQ